jgi:hypothetical protein
LVGAVGSADSIESLCDMENLLAVY